MRHRNASNIHRIRAFTGIHSINADSKLIANSSSLCRKKIAAAINPNPAAVRQGCWITVSRIDHAI
jgi:hypothetical protein